MDRQRLPRLSLDLLRGFRSAARHLSFTHAARELFVTQSAISHQIKTLEEQIGRPLFRRINRALELTETGTELFRAIDEALTLIDNATERAAGPWRTLSVTTTVAMASTWLVPRLPRFAEQHPEVDLRLVATNDAVDLKRDHVDVAIRFTTLDMPPPSQEKLFDYLQFPVCAPALARSRERPLRTLADLSQHVLLEFETILYGRPWYDWQRWSKAMQLPAVKAAGWLRFSHYDQVIEAARKGTGVAVGKWPHLSDHLREGSLVAPLGDAAVAVVGAFYVDRLESGGAASDAFIEWVRAEANGDKMKPVRPSRKKAPGTRRR
ncbi:MAG TPA: LysR substrate-binding domain-containing protein [Burkholderiaceae bacterium]|jgi:DNA-binding transcriptional LysR family regulator|nr:LysR substrate-binding domain-containing protein [Burkholderiaceae bacterium]